MTPRFRVLLDETRAAASSAGAPSARRWAATPLIMAWAAAGGGAAGDDAARSLLVEALGQERNRAATARRLGVSPTTVWRWCVRLGLAPHHRRPDKRKKENET